MKDFRNLVKEAQLYHHNSMRLSHDLSHKVRNVCLHKVVFTNDKIFIDSGVDASPEHLRNRMLKALIVLIYE